MVAVVTGNLAPPPPQKKKKKNLVSRNPTDPTFLKGKHRSKTIADLSSKVAWSVYENSL